MVVSEAGSSRQPDESRAAEPESAPMLSVRGLGIRFGGVVALDDLSFDVAPGALHAVIGPNGAGKTTAFNCITGAYRPSSGEILFRGRSILGVRPAALAGRGIMRTFQHPQVCGKLSVLDNVLLGFHSQAKVGWGAWWLRSPAARREDREAAVEAGRLLAMFDLANVAQRLAEQLPYAALKRLELARALIARPQLLLLDEPAAGLTADDVNAFGDILLALNRDLGITVMLIEHHIGLISRIADRVTVIVDGHTLAEGTAAQVRELDSVREAFLGRSRK